jgi:hypothetical protein
MRELVAAEECVVAAVPSFLQEPQGLRARDGNDTRPPLDELETEGAVLEPGVDVIRRILVELLMRQALTGLRLRAVTVQHADHDVFPNRAGACG